jgi:hypothetical protein
MVGRIFPTMDRNHPQPLPTANFITQEDIGGIKTENINDALLRNAPDTTPIRRGFGAPILMLTGIALKVAETKETIRQSTRSRSSASRRASRRARRSSCSSASRRSSR